MPAYVNRNVRGKWERIEILDLEIAEVAKHNFIANMKTVIQCIKSIPKLLASSKELEGVTVTQPMIENAIKVVSDKMTTPLYFSVEAYVDEQLAKKTENL